MNILYYDCFAGISGDMNLAAMIDLGVDQLFLQAELDKLGLSREFELVVSRDARGGIQGARVEVRLLSGQCVCSHGHGSDDCQSVKNMAVAGEAARSFADIRTILMTSMLNEAVRETSLGIFRRLAEAEAKVHGTSVDAVHFHEVGGMDAIVDIVGAAVCYHYLGVDAVWSSPLELGSGIAYCAHGTIPVPAPATVEILHGIPTTRGATDHEATTPTGAAILAALVDTFTTSPAMTVTKTGYGVGHRVTDVPNLVRVHLATVEADTREATKQVCLLQCNIDDMTGEQLGDVMELFMDSGAMDVHFTAIMMKKNRPGTQISLLCPEYEAAKFKELLFRHTTTLGVKSFLLKRTALDRCYSRIKTPYGPLTIKKALLGGKVVHSKPEYEECKNIARRNNIPLLEVYAAVARQE